MPVNDTWIRVRATRAQTGNSDDAVLADIPLNDTLLRIHAGVSVFIALAGGIPASEIETSHWTLGIYTTLTVGGTILNPGSQQSDFSPPLQRWLWWEQLVPTAFPQPGYPQPDTQQFWRFTPTQNPIDIKASVKATTAISVHLGIANSHVPNGNKIMDVIYWASILRSGL